jgi:hypothetical protein
VWQDGGGDDGSFGREGHLLWGEVEMGLEQGLEAVVGSAVAVAVVEFVAAADVVVVAVVAVAVAAAAAVVVVVADVETVAAAVDGVLLVEYLCP